MRRLMIGAAALALGATPVVAQNVDVSGGLVDVTIQDLTLLTNFLNENEVEILNNANVAAPITVQVPIGIAANVCPNVNAAILAQQLRQDGDADCTATSGSRALAQQVLRQTVRQNR